MGDDVLIRAEGVGKKYMIGHLAERERYVALRDVLARGANNLWRKTADTVRGRPIVAGDSLEEFWALKEVSFEVKRGEVLGIIGRNGAGKSTLLKILSRITEPTEGRVTIGGRVASLLEVGTGFHPELTGRDNIYLNGTILGMTRAEIRRKFDEIVAFAEVEKFLDTPAKRYSSGMYVRLAFAVAAHLDPEILVVDEVLAVGDAEFQKKSLGKMSEVAHGGRTVLFVSHNLAAVEALCHSCLGLHKGMIFATGSPNSVVSGYLGSAQTIRSRVDLTNITLRQGRGHVRFASLSLFDRDGHSIEYARVAQDLLLHIQFRGNDIIGRSSRVSVTFSTSLGGGLFICDTSCTRGNSLSIASGSALQCLIPRLPLSAGGYIIGLFLERAGIIEDWIEAAIRLEVHDGDFYGSGRNTPIGWEGQQVVLVAHSWRVEDENGHTAGELRQVPDGTAALRAPDLRLT
jgi:lipopolysaccharide transport system ATP-binding protein